MSECAVVRLRRAVVEDLYAIAQLELTSSLYEHRREPLTFTLEEMYRLWYKRFTSGEFEIVVAVRNYQILGFLGLKARAQKEAFLQAIYVDPHVHRCGVGSALLSVSDRLCQLHRCPRVKLYVEPKNIEGMAFYRKAGYVQQLQKFHHLYIFVKEYAC